MRNYNSHAEGLMDLLEYRYDLTGNRKYLYPQKIYYDVNEEDPGAVFMSDLNGLDVESTVADYLLDP